MSISYHGVVGHKSKVTLPSVDTWGLNMNILRDPPKSIQTRRIDKVGSTSDITQMIQDSGDRICEGIMTYARGVNPMVSVSYNNYGNNGGQRPASGKGQQAFLPYRVMQDGAFRPPVRDQRMLFPLSRLPRVATSSFTKPGFADFSKQIMCAGTDENTKGVKRPGGLLKACVIPNAVYKIQSSAVETYDIKNNIRDHLNVNADSGKQYNAQYNLHLTDDHSGVLHNPLRVNAQMNKGGAHMQRNIDVSNMNTDRYTHDVLSGEASTNKNQDIHVTPIESILEGYTKDTMTIPYTAHKTSYTKQEYIHDDLEMERNLPYHQATTNTGRNIHMRVIEPVQEREFTSNRPNTYAHTNLGTRQFQAIDNITNRNYNLKPTVTPGGYEPNVGLPSMRQDDLMPEFDQRKVDMRRRIYEMQQDRNGIQNPYVDNIH